MNQRVYWITPITHRGKVSWPSHCATEITTDEARQARRRAGEPLVCGLAAKVMYDGRPLCLRHAQTRALSELIEAP